MLNDGLYLLKLNSSKIVLWVDADKLGRDTAKTEVIFAEKLYLGLDLIVLARYKQIRGSKKASQ